MTRNERARWRRVLLRANTALTHSLDQAMRREFAVCGEEHAHGAWDWTIHRERVQAILARWYEATAQQFAQIAEDMLAGGERMQVREQFTEHPRRELVASLLRDQAPNRARQIAETSQARVTETLLRAARDGWSAERTAKAIQAELGGEIGRSRARTIARTEIGSAQNAALSYVADRNPARVRRRWVAIHDDRTRPAHAAVDGQTIGPGERFRVGGEELRYPGDPEGSPGNVINCRCAMILERIK